MRSVCVNENTWPTWSDPLTVGGGVSMENTSARERSRSKRYVPAASQRAFHFSSRPSSAGFSGRFIGWVSSAPWGIPTDSIDFLADEPLGDSGDDLLDDGLHLGGRAERQLLNYTTSNIINHRLGDHRRGSIA